MPATEPAAAPKAETVAERVRRLQSEAKALAKSHTQSLDDALAAASLIAAEIATGGDAYPPGVREHATRVAVDLDAKALLLRALIGRM